MKTTLGFALGLTMAAGCTPQQIEQQPPAEALHQASTYMAAPTCGPSSVRSLRSVLPDDTLIGAAEIDMQATQRSPLFLDNKKALRDQAKDVLDAMKACRVPLSKVERVVVGFGDGDNFVLGVEAQGIAKPKTLDCLAREAQKVTGKPAWTRTTRGCTTTLDFDGDDGKGFALGRNKLVIASKSMAEGVQRRIDGKDKSLLDGRLSWARSELDLTATAWVGANLPPGAAGSLSPSMKGMNHIGMSIDGSKGMGLKASAGFVSGADASAAETELSGFAAQARMMLPMVGLPTSVADTIVIKSKGTVVTAEMFLSRSDLEALRKIIEDGGGSSSSTSSSPSSSRRGI